MESELKQTGKVPFLQRNVVVFFGAMICVALWGSAYPMVKLGMEILNITSGQMADQVLFAGIRFTIAGFFIVVLGSISQRKLLIPHGVQHAKIWKLSLFQTIGQYSFYYIGLAHTSGVNTAIVDSLAYFLSILAACLLFHMEKLTGKKLLGCVLGFLGVVLVNVNGGGFDFNMTFIGEGMILISAASYSISSVLVKRYSEGDNTVLLSGWQFMAGGIVLILGSLICGGRIHAITPAAVGMLIYLAMVSTVAYTLWAILLKHNDVSKVSIYGFMNPVFGVFFSVLILGETQALNVNYLIALLVVSVGITLVNGKSGGRNKQS